MNDNALKSIINRINGDFYVGVVGSVRSGKSTLINKFFELKILPYINDEFVKNKILDELPQTASGKNIMTVEPKFIPSTSINVNVSDNVNMNIRLVDCVGYIIPSAVGYETEDGPRLVKTPWFADPIEFKEAATIGTKKVISSHSNIGIVVTSDGTIGDFTKEEYNNVLDDIIPKMLELDKPFVVVVNSKEPNGKIALSLKEEIIKKYNISVINVDVLNMTNKDIDNILELALSEFNINELNIALPDYISVLDNDISIKANIDKAITEASTKYKKFKDLKQIELALKDSNLFRDVKIDLVDASSGSAMIKLDLDDDNYQLILKEILGDNINTKADFIKCLYDGNKAKKLYDNIGKALEMAKETGYGVSIPTVEEMKLLPPTLVKQSGRYGVKLSAIAPSIHLIKVDVESTFTPIIGSEQQSQMLIENLISDDANPDEVWNKEIFGRRLSEIVNDGIKTKIYQFPEISKIKLKKVLDKLINSSSSGVIAIIL